MADGNTQLHNHSSVLCCTSENVHKESGGMNGKVVPANSQVGLSDMMLGIVGPTELSTLPQRY